MPRLFFKIAGLLLITNLLAILSGYLVIKWLEKEQVLISPQNAPQIIAERVVNAWENGSIDKLTRKLAQHGTLVALLDEQSTILFSAPQLRRRLENHGPRHFFPHNLERPRRGPNSQRQRHKRVGQLGLNYLDKISI